MRDPRVDPRPIRTYEVRVHGYGSAIYSARSPSKARARAWRDANDAWNWSFHEFLCQSSVRRIEDPPGIPRRALIAGEPGTIIYSPHNGLLYMRDDSDVVFSCHPTEVKPMQSPTP